MPPRSNQEEHHEKRLLRTFALANLRRHPVAGLRPCKGEYSAERRSFLHGTKLLQHQPTSRPHLARRGTSCYPGASGRQPATYLIYCDSHPTR